MRRAFIPLCLGLCACNQYAYFNVAGFEQAKITNDADILFVIDNSTSMREESTALALNFNAFIERLTSEDGAQQKTDDLNDAVDNFVTYVEDRGRFIDYQLGITTTTVDYSVGQTDGVDPWRGRLIARLSPDYWTNMIPMSSSPFERTFCVMPLIGSSLPSSPI